MVVGYSKRTPILDVAALYKCPYCMYVCITCYMRFTLCLNSKLVLYLLFPPSFFFIQAAWDDDDEEEEKEGSEDNGNKGTYFLVVNLLTRL